MQPGLHTILQARRIAVENFVTCATAASVSTEPHPSGASVAAHKKKEEEGEGAEEEEEAAAAALENKQLVLA